MEPDDDSFTITVDNGDDRAVMRPCGEMDMAVEDRWAEAFAVAAAHPSCRVDVDMGAVTFIDSTGLRLVILAHQSAADEGIRLSIVNPSESVQRVGEISGVFEAFERMVRP